MAFKISLASEKHLELSFLLLIVVSLAAHSATHSERSRLVSWETLAYMDLPLIEMHKQHLFSGWKLEDPLMVYVSYAHQAALI